MPTYILLFLQPRNEQITNFPQWRREIFSTWTNISCQLHLDAVDQVTEANEYRHLHVYRFTGPSPSTASEIEEHLQCNYGDSHLTKFNVRLYNFISETRQSTLPAATVVTVEMTIPLDPSSRRELDQWYSQEHVPGLATVPGWQAGTRLQLLHSSGNDGKHAAPYLAIHEWAEPNGLGGESWKQAVFTPWTDRINALQTAPMHRRVWKAI